MINTLLDCQSVNLTDNHRWRSCTQVRLFSIQKPRIWIWLEYSLTIKTYCKTNDGRWPVNNTRCTQAYISEKPAQVTCTSRVLQRHVIAIIITVTSAIMNIIGTLMSWNAYLIIRTNEQTFYRRTARDNIACLTPLSLSKSCVNSSDPELTHVVWTLNRASRLWRYTATVFIDVQRCMKLSIHGQQVCIMPAVIRWNTSF